MPSRLERDIEEILHRLEERPTRRTPRWLRRLRFSLPRPRVPRISSSQMMLGSIAIILLAYLSTYFNPAIARYAIAVGLSLFAVSFFLALRRPRLYSQRRWRGRIIEPERPNLGESLRRWWQRVRGPKARR